MKYFTKKIYLFLLIFLFVEIEAVSKDKSLRYTQGDISNYFLGSLSVNDDRNEKAFIHLNKAKSLKDLHLNYNIKFLRTLVMLEKFEQAFSFSRNVWQENIYFFEADLLLGLESLIKKDFISSERYFQRIEKIPDNDLISQNFVKNFLISWVKAAQNKNEESSYFVNIIPKRYSTLKELQNIFLSCYFNNSETESYFTNLINDENSNFTRYNFFLINYLLHNGEKSKAKDTISNVRKNYSSNLLLKQTDEFMTANKSGKVKKLFNCQNPKDNIAEMFYVIANLYSTQKEYNLSNFYLKISILLNRNFTPNKALLAENFFLQKKYKESQKVYNSLKSIGEIYSWYSSLNEALILSETNGQKYAVSKLRKEFSSLKKHNFQHYFELANFLKDNEIYEESIKYYSLALKDLNKKHALIPKILDRRGTSYERIGEWEKAEKDLKESLEIIPDQPYVLNYLAYSWVEKGINIEQSLRMLEKANELKNNDGYITDSLGWAYYKNQNYFEAEKFLRRAVEIMPQDPVINDHYADVLWVLEKEIQARYVWKYVLGLKSTEDELKNKIEKKLIFGINKKL